ncbi:unnamed protein product [Clavelina lepadiformis]|uniref:Chloride channel protein n=1 Tax=Clavelina lepadiformis TaxID=159417 RepID=A0ABP0G406_CLALP
MPERSKAVKDVLAKFAKIRKKYTSPQVVTEFLFLLILGIIMALLSFAMDYTIEKCQKAHYWLFLELRDSAVLQYFTWVVFPLIFILFSIGFVHIVSPQAIGSGIPEMKTIMRGVVLHEYLTFRVLVAKMVGLTSAIGSRLPIGKEGPFVHIASIVATLMNKLVLPFSTASENEYSLHEMFGAACAVGVACNFAAPIGGVLFSIEVTATYFAVRNYWRGFFSAVCGAFAFRLLAVWNAKEETITALFKTNFRVEFPYDLQELIAFVAIGIFSGFAGALFVYVHRKIVEFFKRKPNIFKNMKMKYFIQPIAVSILMSTLTYPNGLGQLMAGELTPKEKLDTLFDNETWAKLGYIDESNVVVDSQEGWKHPTVNIFATLVIFIVTHFLMSALAITLPIPCGIFMPVFLIGAAFGRLVGEAMASLYPDGFHSGEKIYRIVPGGYAVVGAASLSGAVTHTISTSVIVFELTGQISHILPVMIAVLIANAIAQWLQPSIYDSIILIKNLPYIPYVGTNNKQLRDIYVEDIMIRDLKFVSYTSTRKDLENDIKNTNLKILPLVDSKESMILIGSVQVSNLQDLLNNPEAQGTSPSPNADGSSTYSCHKTSRCNLFPADKGHSAEAELQHVSSFDTIELDAENKSCFEQTDLLVNFGNCKINPSPFQLVERTSLYKAHILFSLLSVRRAYITSYGKLVGVVSLKELSTAIQGTLEHRHERIHSPVRNTKTQMQEHLLSQNEVTPLVD